LTLTEVREKTVIPQSYPNCVNELIKQKSKQNLSNCLENTSKVVKLVGLSIKKINNALLDINFLKSVLQKR